MLGGLLIAIRMVGLPVMESGLDIHQIVDAVVVAVDNGLAADTYPVERTTMAALVNPASVARWCTAVVAAMELDQRAETDLVQHTIHLMGSSRPKIEME